VGVVVGAGVGVVVGAGVGVVVGAGVGVVVGETIKPMVATDPGGRASVLSIDDEDAVMGP